MSYEVGWHSSDDQYCHVARVDDDERDELFDVQLYGDGSGSEESEGHRTASLAALERLVERANLAPEGKVVLALDPAEAELVAEALDSHVYWQLSEPERRSSGYVLEPYTEEEQAALDLEAQVRAALNATQEVAE